MTVREVSADKPGQQGRGVRPLCVVIYIRSELDLASLKDLPSSLKGECIEELEVHCPAWASQDVTTFIERLAAEVQGLSTLRFTYVCPALPSPGILPHLSHLQLYYIPSHDVGATVVPYLDQIGSLDIHHGLYWAFINRVVNFTASSITSFSTKSDIGDHDLTMLVEHMPNLRNLSAGEKCSCVLLTFQHAFRASTHPMHTRNALRRCILILINRAVHELSLWHTHPPCGLPMCLFVCFIFTLPPS